MATNKPTKGTPPRDPKTLQVQTTEQDISKALAKIATGVTAFNAVWAVVLATVLYLALRPALKKAGLFHDI